MEVEGGAVVELGLEVVLVLLVVVGVEGVEVEVVEPTVVGLKVGASGLPLTAGTVEVEVVPLVVPFPLLLSLLETVIGSKVVLMLIASRSRTDCIVDHSTSSA